MIILYVETIINQVAVEYVSLKFLYSSRLAKVGMERFVGLWGCEIVKVLLREGGEGGWVVWDGNFGGRGEVMGVEEVLLHQASRALVPFFLAGYVPYPAGLSLISD